MEFECTNKRCKHITHFSVGKEDINTTPFCPCCDSYMIRLDKEKLINDHVESISHLTMLNNIKHFGVDGTFKKIDEHYRNPITRARMRGLLSKVVKKMKNKEYDEN